MPDAVTLQNEVKCWQHNANLWVKYITSATCNEVLWRNIDVEEMLNDCINAHFLERVIVKELVCLMTALLPISGRCDSERITQLTHICGHNGSIIAAYFSELPWIHRVTLSQIYPIMWQHTNDRLHEHRKWQTLWVVMHHVIQQDCAEVVSWPQ